MMSKKHASLILLGVSLYLTFLFVPFNLPMKRVATSEFDGNWQINAYGVTIHVHLAAPTYTVTMVLNWFNASAEVVSINSDPPYNVRYVYIYNLSHLIMTPRQGSYGFSSSTRNLTVGEKVWNKHRDIFSAASVNLLPGQSTTLTYHISVEMGVERENGTLNTLIRNFQYQFIIEAGEDALDYFFQVQQQLLMTLGIASLIFIVLIIGVVYYRQRGR